MRPILLAACLLASCLLAQSNPTPPSAQPPVAWVCRTLTRPDMALHYRDMGQGEPVLLLMGGPGVAADGLEPVAQMIAKQGRAIVPDQRGSGKSQPKDSKAVTLDATLADLEALRKELDLKQWTVWGCSWGGMLALDYAAKHPGSVKALVLVGSGGPSWASFTQVFGDNMAARTTSDERAAQRYWSRPDVVARDPELAAAEWLKAILPSQFYDRSKVFAAQALFKPGRQYYNEGAGEYINPAFEQGAPARIEALKKRDIPALILHGRQDPMPESVALENQRLLRASRLVWLDRCGHWPWLEQPEALEKAMLAFLQPLPPEKP